MELRAPAQPAGRPSRGADAGALVTLGLHMEDLEQDRTLGPLEAAGMRFDAIWLLGMGGFLKRERPALGWLTLVFGFFMLVNSLGSLLDNSTLSMIGFSGNLLILPLWAMWIGVDLLRRPALTSQR